MTDKNSSCDAVTFIEAPEYPPKEQPTGWVTTWTAKPGEPCKSETIIEAEPVDLDKLELPVCERCGTLAQLKLIGVCGDHKPYLVPMWHCLEPVCSACKRVVPWDHPRVFPGEEEGTAWTPVIRQQ